MDHFWFILGSKKCSVLGRFWCAKMVRFGDFECGVHHPADMQPSWVEEITFSQILRFVSATEEVLDQSSASLPVGGLFIRSTHTYRNVTSSWLFLQRKQTLPNTLQPAVGTGIIIDHMKPPAIKWAHYWFFDGFLTSNARRTRRFQWNRFRSILFERYDHKLSEKWKFMRKLHLGAKIEPRKVSEPRKFQDFL